MAGRNESTAVLTFMWSVHPFFDALRFRHESVSSPTIFSANALIFSLALSRKKVLFRNSAPGTFLLVVSNGSGSRTRNQNLPP